MNEENDEIYLDLVENDEIMDEYEAKQIYEQLLKQRGINLGQGTKAQIPNDLILELKKLTKLSARRIASITNLNKDKVNGILKNLRQ